MCAATNAVAQPAGGALRWRRLGQALIALLASATSVLPATPEPGPSFVVAPPSRLVLEGASNLGAWRCQGSDLDVEVTLAVSLDRLNELIDRIENGDLAEWMPPEARAVLPAPSPSFAFSTPVRGLRCGNPVMERDLRRTLSADRHPQVQYRFTALRGGVVHDLDLGVYRAVVAGDLALAGTSRQVELPVEIRRLARDRFRLTAQLPLRMTDFGLVPPTALFGMVQARDELRVRFELTVLATAPPRVSRHGGSARVRGSAATHPGDPS